MKYNGIVLADIHMGAIPYEKIANELELVYSIINHMKKLNYIIIAGDYFDKKMYINDPNGHLAIEWFMNFMDFCSKSFDNQIKVRIVYGTESHDSNQYNVFETCNKLFENIDLKVIKTVTEEELFEDVNVLYLPEEHIIDPDKYYEKYYNNIQKYNYVFGHGVVNEVMKAAVSHTDNNTKRKKVPNFRVGDLIRMTKGEIYFGHYHTRTDIHIFHYVGSYSRWKFGEEPDKGFYKLSYNTYDDFYDSEFIVNELADMYITYSYDINNPIYNSAEKMKSTLDRVDKLIDSGISDHIRLQFDIPTSSDKEEFYTHYIQDRYKFDKNVKLNINNINDINEHIHEEDTKKNKTDNEITKILFDRNKDISDKISEFISLEYGKNISPEKTDKYLHYSLNDIMSI